MAETYSTWDYYQGAYGGALAQADYAAFALRAAYEIDHRTLGQAATAGAAMAGALSQCECELAEALHAWAQAPRGVSRVGNDGLSVTYGGRNSYDGLADEPATMERICRKYLTGPENLMAACGRVLEG